MAGPVGVNPVLVPLSTGVPSAVGALRPGQFLQGIVEGTSGNLSLQVAGTTVSLAPGSGLLPGQSVEVEVLGTREGLQLRLLPSDAKPPSAEPTPPSSMLTVLTSVLKSLEAANVPVSTASPLLPGSLPPVESAVRSLLSLFLTRGGSAADLAQIAAYVHQAAVAGAIPASLMEDLDALLARVLLGDAETIRKALARSGQSAAKSPEARLASAFGSGAQTELLSQLADDLRHQLGALRQWDGLDRFLRRNGAQADFEQTVARVLERVTGTHLQNLHALEQPYLFLELPFSAEGPIRHALVHFLGEGKKGRAIDSSNATVVLDLSTTHLGDLWISLRLAGKHCTCWFRAMTPAVSEAIAAAGPELVQNLTHAGYPDSEVRSGLWNGDRLQETANLMRRFTGIDVRA